MGMGGEIFKNLQLWALLLFGAKDYFNAKYLVYYTFATISAAQASRIKKFSAVFTTK